MWLINFSMLSSRYFNVFSFKTRSINYVECIFVYSVMQESQLLTRLSSVDIPVNLFIYCLFYFQLTFTCCFKKKFLVPYSPYRISCFPTGCLSQKWISGVNYTFQNSGHKVEVCRVRCIFVSHFRISPP